ncbi:hypothetical protein BKA67DRAFT_540248 [Truncatella angustata]|uniref:Uncharacterized protein n=1 Tax=Truncatella angustata TaxID=152316 RepID=A0A9P8UCW8_9PEZI|nr:uncharacterized protein BKA67DRAFT_540248 [Truncatella angustata]KAH6646760.1 hypothetical protein BKA67DRAFT_540248 [Truncatella angustata]
MHIINILTTAFLPAALVCAAPGADLDISIRDASCPGDQAWCGWTKSYAENKYRWNDGHKIFCSKHEDIPKKLKEKCPNDHPACKPTQVWDGDSKSSKCPNGKVWHVETCKHPLMPKSSYSGKEKPCCAKIKNDWCAYAPGKEQKYCEQYWN